jgi:hypothetical protein
MESEPILGTISRKIALQNFILGCLAQIMPEMHLPHLRTLEFRTCHPARNPFAEICKRCILDRFDLCLTAKLIAVSIGLVGHLIVEVDHLTFDVAAHATYRDPIFRCDWRPATVVAMRR